MDQKTELERERTKLTADVDLLTSLVALYAIGIPLAAGLSAS